MSAVPDFGGGFDTSSLGDVTGSTGGDELGLLPQTTGGDASAGAGDAGLFDNSNEMGLSPLQAMFAQSQHVEPVNASTPSNGPSVEDLFRDASRNSTQATNSGPQAAGSQDGMLQQIMKGMGLSGKSGGIDLSDPKQLQAWMKLILAGGGVLGGLMQRKPAYYKSPQDLLNSQGGGTPSMTFNPQQQASANAFFGSGAMPWNQHPIALAQPGSVEQPGHTYAMGGAVYDDGGGVLSDPQLQAQASPQPDDPQSGALGQVAGGQDDTIDASLSPGEYVWDADTVAAVGDGDNEAGAKRLDQFRQALRAQKRSAPPTEIPPRTRPLPSYMPKGGV